MSSRSTTRNAEAGRDEEVGLAATGCSARRPARRRRLERAQGGRADGDDAAAARRARRAIASAAVGADLVPLAVHPVLGEVARCAPAGRCRRRRAASRRRARRRARAARRAARRRSAAPRSARRPRPGARRTRSGSAATSSRVVGVLDVGRQRHVAVAFEQGAAGRAGKRSGTATRRCPRGRAPRRRRRRRSAATLPALRRLAGLHCATTSSSAARARPAARPCRRWPSRRTGAP